MSADERAHIAAHLDECAICRARLEQIGESVQLMRQLPQIEPGDELWDSIALKLTPSKGPKMPRGVSPTMPLRFGVWWLRPVAIVASLFIIATATLLASRYGILPGTHKAELNLAGYLDLVSTVALAEPTVKEFPAAPGFTEVKWSEANATAKFPVIAPPTLPGGYQLTTVRLYSQGDLRALQFNYRGEQGGLCVFQLPIGSKLSFGERPSEQYKADGVYCRRTSSTSCSVYRFEVGETQCVLMVRESDSAIVPSLIKAFYAEYEKTQKQRT
ncbi:MAG TPA: hypothetical protein VJS64_17165 [Pyrinomonadaceae bacterium]|nr:hypothetical protein [Pyrinomonadaceae bacterium]